MTPKNGTTVDLNVNTESDLMPVDNTDDEYVLTISPIDNPKIPTQPAAATSYSLRYNLITASKYALYPSAALSDALTSFSKSHNNTE